MNISHLFNKTVDSYRPTQTTDAVGSPKNSYVANLSSVSCRIQQRTGLEPVEGGRKYSKPSYVLYCSSDTDIVLKDVILYNSNYYNVVESKIEGNSDTYLKIVMEKTDSEKIV